MSHYSHLSIEEREILYLMRGQGKSFREIARTLNRSPSTISREWKRGKSNKQAYFPSRAHARYKIRRKNCGRKRILFDPVLKEKIRHLIEDLHWSPEQISFRLKLENNPFQISWITIYRFIWDGFLDTTTSRKFYRKKSQRFISKLRKKGKRRKKNGSTRKQGKFNILHTIDERPEGSTNRTELGHFEGDTVMGKKGGARLVTMVDRTSRLTMAKKCPSGESEATNETIIEMMKLWPEGMVKSITPDRGREFARYQNISEEYSHVVFYFPPAYSPWERGTNENTNGLIREYIPKGIDIDSFSDEYIQQIVDDLNYRPRKCLGWRTPYEVHFEKVLHLT